MNHGQPLIQPDLRSTGRKLKPTCNAPSVTTLRRTKEHRKNRKRRKKPFSHNPPWVKNSWHPLRKPDSVKSWHRASSVSAGQQNKTQEAGSRSSERQKELAGGTLCTRNPAQNIRTSGPHRQPLADTGLSLPCRTRTPGRFALPAAAQQTPDTDAGHHDGGDVQQHLRKTLRWLWRD